MAGSTGDFGAMFAATTVPGTPVQAVPSSSPITAEVPTGRSPTAKRPLDRASIETAITGRRPMSVEDLTGGFYNLHENTEKEAKLLQSTAKAVHYNADLLNALIARVNSAEAAMQLCSEGMAKQDANVTKLTEDVKLAVKTLEDGDSKKDATLRQELDIMAQKLETGHDEILAKIATSTAASAMASVATSSATPRIGASRSNTKHENTLISAKLI